MVVPIVRSVYHCTDCFGQVKSAVVISGMIYMYSKYTPNFFYNIFVNYRSDMINYENIQFHLLHVVATLKKFFN